MGKLFHPDSKLMRVVNIIGDLVILNLLWVVCCLPVITIGPATTALYVGVHKIVKGESQALPKTFLQAFRSNFKPALITSLILLFPVILITGYFFLALSGALDQMKELRFLCWLAIVIVSVVCSYVYPLLATFENTVFNTLKNAMILPLSNPVIALAVTVLNLLPILLLITNFSLFVRISVFWILIGGALAAFLNTKMLNVQFLKFIPAEGANRLEQQLR